MMIPCIPEMGSITHQQIYATQRAFFWVFLG